MKRELITIGTLFLGIISILTIGIYNYKVDSNRSGNDIEVICFDGHQYIINNAMERYGIANKLNDDGTPVQC